MSENKDLHDKEPKLSDLTVSTEENTTDNGQAVLEKDTANRLWLQVNCY